MQILFFRSLMRYRSVIPTPASHQRLSGLVQFDIDNLLATFRFPVEEFYMNVESLL